MKSHERFPAFLAALLMAACAQANVTLPRVTGDHMVLQRDVPVPVWGWADPGEHVTVKFNGGTYRAVTAADSSWKVLLKALPAGGPFTMQISGRNTITLTDVLVGDVWFCSGQSNMVLNMERVKEKYPQEIEHADYPLMRNFFVPTASDVAVPHKDLPPGEWKPVVGENILGMGAATYFFAKSLYNKYEIPIGIINSSVGGTPIQAWISASGFGEFPEYQAMIRNFADTGFVNEGRRLARQRVVSDAKPFPEEDMGTAGPVPWYNPAYQATGWHDFWLPGYLEDQGVTGLDGVVWFRKEIDVPGSMTGKPANLYLGRIVDADQVYVNGEPSGGITYQYPPRRYPLPAGRLRSGKNLIVVRVTNYSNKGGFVPDKPYYLVAGSDSIDLRGEWKYRVGQVFPPRDRSGESGRMFSDQNAPTGLYNTMVAPAVPYAIKGFAWYQGESNAGRPDEYEGLLRSLITDWRNKWGLGKLPFIYVQLPNFMEVNYWPSESNWAELREGQRKVLDERENVAMVVTIDLGEWNDVHPLNKKGVGERLALAAERLAYGDEDVVYSGPLYRSHEIKGNKVIITFSHTGTGMVAKGNDELHHFAIAGEDGNYVWAHAEIEDDKIIVWSDEVPRPVSVRYAWADNPGQANLYNIEGLPASPFQTLR